MYPPEAAITENRRNPYLSSWAFPATGAPAASQTLNREPHFEQTAS